MSYDNLSTLGKKVYGFYKQNLYSAVQVQQFANKAKLTQEEVDFILQEENT